MEQNQDNQNVEDKEIINIKKENFYNKVTPFSKYLALILFVVLPFFGFWIGYSYSPEKVVEVEKIVEVEKEVEVQVPVIENDLDNTEETLLDKPETNIILDNSEDETVTFDSEVKKMLELAQNQITIINSEQKLEGYENVCNDTQVYKILLTLGQSYEKPLKIVNDGFNDDYSVTCNDSTDGFLITAPLSEKNMRWCIDALGTSRDLMIATRENGSIICGQ